MGVVVVVVGVVVLVVDVVVVGVVDLVHTVIFRRRTRLLGWLALSWKPKDEGSSSSTRDLTTGALPVIWHSELSASVPTCSFRYVHR